MDWVGSLTGATVWWAYQPRIYYHHVSARTIQEKKRQLTLNNYVLTSLFVALALTADLVGKAITLMSEGPTMLTSQDSCHQLILDMEDQKLPNSKENKK